MDSSAAVAPIRLEPVRLDRALALDVRRAVRSRPLLLFLAIELVAGAIFVDRRGSGTASSVMLIWVAMLCLAFFAWWAGRHPRAHPRPDPMPGAGARSAFALLAAAGMLVWSTPLGPSVGFVLLACGVGGWLWAAWRTGGLRGSGGRLTRDPRPLVPLLLLIALPRLAIQGPAYLAGILVALPSGVGQQLLFLLGLFAPLEAALGRSDRAAVLAALVFGLLHVPIVMAANHGDILAAAANAVIFQSSVGLIACLAFVRHRAVLPVGAAHALAL